MFFLTLNKLSGFVCICEQLISEFGLAVTGYIQSEMVL